jgi:uncharacterized protein YigE (DUF2233 family)
VRRVEILPVPAARRWPIGRLVALVALVVGGIVVARGAARPPFRTVEPGVEFGLISGEPYCRWGSPQIAVMRLDPARVRLRVLHYSRQPERRPLSIVEWQKRSGALAVFNAGQYYPDLSYMGLLKSDGVVISPRRHPTFQAALVAGPAGHGSRARVLDLSRHSLDARTPEWRQVAQSFMLFDVTGAVRARKSAQVANRTAVGEDASGRLVVITSEGGYTLHDFALLLQASSLKLTHAMAMDGGHEAELCVRSRNFRYASFGRWDPDGEPEAAAAGTLVPLPAVITVHVE